MMVAQSLSDDKHYRNCMVKDRQSHLACETSYSKVLLECVLMSRCNFNPIYLNCCEFDCTFRNKSNSNS